MALKKDQILVDRFIKALVSDVTTHFPRKIDFVILFGSAARGEFIPGVSDIDLVIQLKEQKDIAAVNAHSTEAFWKLNKRFKTGFEKSCATRPGKTPLARLFNKLESKAHLYTPLFVYGPADLDWERGRVKKRALQLPARLIISQATIFHKFKTEGKLYFGRDIRKVIHPHFTWWERWKGIMIPYWLCLFAALTSLIAPIRAAKYSTKAILYEIDSAVVYLLDLKKQSRASKVKRLQKDIVLRMHTTKLVTFSSTLQFSIVNKNAFRIVDEALAYKINGFHGSRAEAARYSLRALWFIIRLQWHVVISHLTRA